MRHRPELHDWAIVVVLCGLELWPIWTVALTRISLLWSLPLDLAARVALPAASIDHLPVLSLVVAVDVAQIVADPQAGTLIYVTLIAIYWVAAYASRQPGGPSRLVAVPTTATSVCCFHLPATIEGGALEAAMAFMAAAAVFGEDVRTRRDYVASRRGARPRLERERDAQKASDRRPRPSTRIAREMHDAVATACPRRRRKPMPPRYVFDSKAAQAQQRHRHGRRDRPARPDRHVSLPGVLRSTTAKVTGPPSPASNRTTRPSPAPRLPGLPVSADRSGLTGHVSARGCRLTVDRIVQEALTNTLEDAGPAVTATGAASLPAHDELGDRRH